MVKETWGNFPNCRKTYGGSSRKSSGQEFLTFLCSLFWESGKAFEPPSMFSKLFFKGITRKNYTEIVKYLRTIFSIELCVNELDEMYYIYNTVREFGSGNGQVAYNRLTTC